MNNRPLSLRLQLGLTRMAAAQGVTRELAYIIAGLAITFGLLRPPQPAKPVSSAMLGIALVLLLAFLLLIGPVLGVLAPVFWAMGLLPDGMIPLVVVVTLLARMRSIGRKLLLSL